VFPSAVERAYLAILRKRVNALTAVIRKAVLPRLDGSTPSVGAAVASATKGIRTDASTSPDEAIEEVRQIFLDRIPPDEAALTGLAGRVDGAAQAHVARLAVGVIPIHLDHDTSGWLAENIALIKSIDAQYLDDVATFVKVAQAEGWSAARAGREIAAITGTPLSRAKLVARDQIATLNGQITQQRQTEAGVKRYRWSTSQDERVRPEHEALEGRIFDWNDPPAEGHPGEPINCRCVAIPVLD